MSESAVAWGWVAHLRSGGTTPWRGWTQRGDEDGWALPGAQQLELLRRVNLRGSPDRRLVERILSASAAGRGRPDLELVGVAQDERFGPRAVDPEELPAAELLRVATTVLAEDLVAAGPPPPARVRRARPWATRYRLAGDPWLCSVLAADLGARGRPPGGPGAPVHVVGTDLATMLGHVWTVRALRGAGPSWADFLADLVRRSSLPRRVDLASVAERRARPGGADRVRVVLDPALVPGLVGLRRGPPAPPAVAATAVELARRTSGALGLLVEPRARAALLRRVLLPRLVDVPGEPPGPAPEHVDWVAERARSLRDRLAAGRYIVHGDPDLLVPRAGAGPAGSGPHEGSVLELATDLLLVPVSGKEDRP